MTDDELTQEEVLALASAFPVASAKALLSAARFPSWAIPESGFANAREFWIKVADQVADGVMEDGRRKILIEARRIYPYSKKIPEPAPVAGASAGTDPSPASAPRSSGGPAVYVSGSQGVQFGNGNTQLNFFATDPGQPAPGQSELVRVLVIGASPLDPDLPAVRSDREAHAIMGVTAPDRVAVRAVLGAEATDVRQVGSFQPHIVHFVCHGTADSLVFNDTRGESDYVGAARVAQTLALYRETPGVRLHAIVLAACDGHTLAPCFTGVAGLVIAHRGRLSDPCGVTFAQQFYTLLNDAARPGQDAGRKSMDLGAIAREAAQLTAQFSAACESVTENLILLPGDG
jgi:Effector-associated domain 1/CHAT domain